MQREERECGNQDTCQNKAQVAWPLSLAGLCKGAATPHINHSEPSLWLRGSLVLSHLCQEGLQWGCCTGDIRAVKENKSKYC